MPWNIMSSGPDVFLEPGRANNQQQTETNQQKKQWKSQMGKLYIGKCWKQTNQNQLEANCNG